MAEEFVTVHVETGALRGRRVQLKGSGAYVSFKGVPYAKPPLGLLRFKDAQPLEPWQGVRDALEEGGVCTQLNMDAKDYLGVEDCLYLNVYSPQLPTPGVDALPVMVWFHGGGFVSGSGGVMHYGPDYLVTENVVLVTVNYRLGPFGFLYMEAAAPGNAGLKDQVAAMRWVQKNISVFGGNPKNVTIFGESAGGASVQLHMLSPMSKGLFHRAIAQSGAALNPWAIQTEPAETTRRLARALGCTSDDPFAIVDFLRGVDHLTLIRAANEQAPVERDRGRILRFSFVPTPEYSVNGVEMFLPAPIEHLMQKGHHAVPYMTGLTSQEGLLLLAAADFRDEKVARKLDAEWETNLLPELRLPVGSDRARDALKSLRNFYMGGRPFSKEMKPGFLDMFSDILFGEGIAYAVKCISKTAKAPLYFYNFIVDDELNYLKKMWDINEPGACHADENGYLFSSTRINNDLPATSSAVLVRRRLLRLWANFARTGNPTPEEDSLLGVHWKPYTNEERNYLEIGPELRQRKDLYASRFEFWDEFYRKFLP